MSKRFPALSESGWLVLLYSSSGRFVPHTLTLRRSALGCASCPAVRRISTRCGSTPEATQGQIDVLLNPIPSRIGWHLWKIDLRFGPGSRLDLRFKWSVPPGFSRQTRPTGQIAVKAYAVLSHAPCPGCRNLDPEPSTPNPTGVPRS